MHSKHNTKALSPPQWDNRLLCGHPDIDLDHKSLFAIAARLFATKQSDVSFSVIGEVLSQLADYAGEHFAHEELLMDQADYPGCDEHICQHLEFIQKLSILIDTYERGRTDVLPELQSVLFDWLLNHTSDDDRISVSFGDRRIQA